MPAEIRSKPPGSPIAMAASSPAASGASSPDPITTIRCSGARRAANAKRRSWRPGSRPLQASQTQAAPDAKPTTSAVLSDRKNGVYLLPACTSYEMDGSRTASNRSTYVGSP